jgi:hypothetical protein
MKDDIDRWRRLQERYYTGGGQPDSEQSWGRLPFSLLASSGPVVASQTPRTHGSPYQKYFFATPKRSLLHTAFEVVQSESLRSDCGRSAMAVLVPPEAATQTGNPSRYQPGFTHYKPLLEPWQCVKSF